MQFWKNMKQRDHFLYLHASQSCTSDYTNQYRMANDLFIFSSN